MKIGFMGLGQMGSGIAENLMKAGHEVVVWNRSPGPAIALAKKGASVAQEPEGTLQADVLFSMLANDGAIEEVGLTGPLLSHAPRGLVHVNLATISPDLARRLTLAHEVRRIGYVAAPVFGRPDAAAAGNLVIIAAGAAADISMVRPLLQCIGRRVEVIGEVQEQANLFKIAGNFMIASAMETMGEAFALLKKGGVDVSVFHEVLSSSLFAGIVFQNYGKMIAEERFEPAGFALKLGLKDVNLAREAAADMNMTMPLADLVREHFDEAVKAGWAEKDWSALGGIIARRAGV
jgi:3-hydroxyisobutyrate dehydrogenase-like beta-hydroxyacid dehydrogenase